MNKTAFTIHVHLNDGSIASFAQPDEGEAKKFWGNIEPSRLFAQPRIVLAGDHSKSVFVSAHILRIDFVKEGLQCWEFPNEYSDIVELSEEEYRKNARLDHPEQMARRMEPTPVGDLLVSFLKLQMRGGKPIFLMVEASVKLPVDNHSFMRFLLSGGSFHMRLRAGGVGVVNLANLAGYTVYPGVPQVPADTWMVEPVPDPHGNLRTSSS
jgi:hypothetical protein